MQEQRPAGEPTRRGGVVLRPEVELEGGDADAVLRGIAERVPVPR